VYVPYRAFRQPIHFDATIHPERALSPPEGDSNTVLAHKPVSSSSFTYAELFAGIGGFGVALDALGGTCMFCSELQERCRNVYAANFPNTDSTVVHGDIGLVPDNALPRPGSLDLVVGGFPCQPFSKLGNQPGLDCPKNGSHLFREILRVLIVSQPKAFLFENVPGLLGTRDTLDVMIDAFRNEAGYDVTFEVCNARCLTASSRKRLFFVGLRQCENNDTSTNDFTFPYIPDLRLRARDVLDYYFDIDDDCCNDNVPRRLLHLSPDQLKQLLASKRWRPADLAWPNTVLETLVSHYGVSICRGRLSGQLVPTNRGTPRRFTPRECLRLMGFPRSYVVPTVQTRLELNEQYQMIGNAVPPPLVAALAGAVLGHTQPQHLNNERDSWIAFGQATGIALARRATSASGKRNNGLQQ